MFRPHAVLIHHCEVADLVGFDAGRIRGILTARGLRGYHAIHEQVDGEWWTSVLNPWTAPAEHVRGANSKYLGFAFIADFNKVAPTAEQLKTGARSVAMMLSLFGLSAGDIYPHSAVNDTDCPGRLFPWDRFAGLVRLYRGDGPSVVGWRDAGASA